MRNSKRGLVGILSIVIIVVLIVSGGIYYWYSTQPICGNGLIERGETGETCCYDTGCGEGKICITGSCEDVICGPCQHLVGDTCIDYSCCEDADCDDFNDDTIDTCDSNHLCFYESVPYVEEEIPEVANDISNDCGLSVDITTLEEIVVDTEGGTLTTRDYESDSSLVCFGNKLLVCNISNVSINTGEGIIKLSVAGKSDDNCIIKQEYGTMTSEIYGPYSNTDLQCTYPISDIPSIACPFGACVEEGAPGETAVGISSGMFVDALMNPESTCTGTFMDKR